MGDDQNVICLQYILASLLEPALRDLLQQQLASDGNLIEHLIRSADESASSGSGRSELLDEEREQLLAGEIAEWNLSLLIKVLLFSSSSSLSEKVGKEKCKAIMAVQKVHNKVKDIVYGNLFLGGEFERDFENLRSAGIVLGIEEVRFQEARGCMDEELGEEIIQAATTELVVKAHGKKERRKEKRLKRKEQREQKQQKGENEEKTEYIFAKTLDEAIAAIEKGERFIKFFSEDDVPCPIWNDQFVRFIPYLVQLERAIFLSNGFGEGVLSNLAEALKGNKNLKVLSFIHTKAISDKSLPVLIRLVENSSLDRLGLFGTRVSKENQSLLDEKLRLCKKSPANRSPSVPSQIFSSKDFINNLDTLSTMKHRVEIAVMIHNLAYMNQHFLELSKEQQIHTLNSSATMDQSENQEIDGDKSLSEAPSELSKKKLTNHMKLMLKSINPFKPLNEADVSDDSEALEGPLVQEVQELKKNLESANQAIEEAIKQLENLSKSLPKFINLANQEIGAQLLPSEFGKPREGTSFEEGLENTNDDSKGALEDENLNQEFPLDAVTVYGTLNSHWFLAQGGGTSTVIKVKDKVNGRGYVFKKLSDVSSICIGLEHPNIVKVIGASNDSKFTDANEIRLGIGVMMEDCEGGSLRNFLDRSLTISPITTFNILLDAARGMDYLHQQEPDAIIHGDLRSDNIFLSLDLKGKVRMIGIDAKRVSSSRYKSPEYLEGNLCLESDVYAFGCLIFECLTLKRPWDGLENADIFAKVLVEKAQLDFAVLDSPPGLVDLMRRCLEHDKTKRPSFSEICDTLEELARAWVA